MLRNRVEERDLPPVPCLISTIEFDSINARSSEQVETKEPSLLVRRSNASTTFALSKRASLTYWSSSTMANETPAALHGDTRQLDASTHVPSTQC